MILKSLPIAKEFLTVFIPPKFTVEADGIDRKPELALLKANDDNSILSVSYTHLTLPTILLV